MSRLENNSESIRNELISRNSYNASNIYDINNSTVVDIINTTSRLLRPGNAFDFSNTVIGRIVGPNTPIAVIGNKALANLYTSQVVSTLVRKNVPTINLDNLFNGKSIIEKNIDYSITKETGNNLQEKIFNTLRYSSGINRLSNPIPTNITQQNLITQFTGKGQINTLENLLSNNIYSNNIKNTLLVDNTEYLNNIIQNKTTGTLNIYDYQLSSKDFLVDREGNFGNINSNLTSLRSYFSKRYSSIYYGTDDNVKKYNYSSINKNFGNDSTKIQELSKTTNEDIVTLNNGENTFTWGMTPPNDVNDSKGILGYTNALFNSFNGDNNPISINKAVSQITVNGKSYYNGIKYADRAYSVNNQYNSISKTIRPYGNNKKNSVINDNPIPKFIYDTSGSNNTVMFSIENLAIDSKTVTIPSEVGPNNGRIMWFVPSIIDYNEDITPNITATNFLGRGEPVYTYANTERKLTISFYIVVDYAEEFINVKSFEEFQNKIYNKLKPDPNSTQNKKLLINVDELNKQNKAIQKEVENITNKSVIPTFDNLPIDLYYPINVSDVLTEYESYNSNFDNNLDGLLSKINNSLNENNNTNFEITIKSTVNDSLLSPEILYRQRSEKFKTYITNKINQNYPKLINRITIINEEVPESSLSIINFDNNTVNSEDSIKKRKSTIVSVISSINNQNFGNEITENIPTENTNALLTQKEDIEEATVIGDTSLLLFDNDITTNTNGSFNKVRTRTIQNGFMSYTPEDLYKRLTFLHQCTRQGRTQISDGKISNSVFGRPPVIVFKLGDVYNTKAMITSLNLSFENEIPWDLNPEGFGVQKMGCKVTMNMNLIGASTIEGPKSHILNGESRRFYANSSYESDARSTDILDQEEK